MDKKIVLTGDRPTGNLHIGHFVGSLRERVKMQDTGEYEIYVLIADLQALTDNANNPERIKNSIMEIMLDYLAVGLSPDKVHFVLQSSVPALSELTMYYMNIVTQARLERNPTVKAEIKTKGFEKSCPVGFMVYPISQASDITAFGANIVPVGEDQKPMLEQTREIVATFNRLYGKNAGKACNADNVGNADNACNADNVGRVENIGNAGEVGSSDNVENPDNAENAERGILVLPDGLYPPKNCGRLCGTDGNGKMSKSLGNCIYIKDDEETLKEKIIQMYTDPNHIKITDGGKVEGNVVFTYLDAFATNDDFAKYLPEYKNLEALKNHYRRGGLGDIKVKTFLFKILNELLRPMRERRSEYEKKPDEVRQYLRRGTEKAIAVTNKTLQNVRHAIGIYEITEE
ncbi:MAG: tryptophan--tRNA ligase [Christensenellaceae bacterium]|jgi:tryptophanyl-tRNA synthetase|nr:tryptophan--tRNA ligase [Christensenellaceae bacterium]